MAMLCALFLLVALTPLGYSDGAVMLQAISTSSEYHQDKVLLQCLGESENVTIFRRIGNSSMVVTLFDGIPNVMGLTFILDHRTEGIYYCQDGNVKSQEVLLVAYPFSDLTITRSYSANIGDELTVHCTIPMGVLTDRYSVRWFKGLNEIDTSSSSRISLNGFALVFSSVESSDYGSGYYCMVSVRVKGDRVVKRQGSTIALNIMGPLQLLSGLVNTAALVGEKLRLTCHAEGVPSPKFRWLVNGQQQEVGVTDSEVSRADAVSTESEYVVSEVEERHTGPVTCVALHERNGEIFTVSSTANLVVLTNMFKVTLALQHGELRLRGQLPVHITGAFTLKVRFYNSDTITEESILSDPSLADTREINIVIVKEKMPKLFRDFTVAIAIMSSDRSGPFTPPSNRIVMPSIINTCECGSTPSTTIIALVVAFLVILVLLTVVIVVGCIVIFYMKGVLCKSNSLSNYSSRGSLPRSRSHCSCRSSESCGSRCKSRSEVTMDQLRGMELNTMSPRLEDGGLLLEYECIDEKKVDSPGDVRDFETLDHKDLRQWEKREYKHQVGSPQLELVAEPQVRQHEPVFPRTHIGVVTCAVNPIHRERSVSPFEVLEAEANLKFSTQIPRSC